MFSDAINYANSLFGGIYGLEIYIRCTSGQTHRCNAVIAYNTIAIQSTITGSACSIRGLTDSTVLDFVVNRAPKFSISDVTIYNCNFRTNQTKLISTNLNFVGAICSVLITYTTWVGYQKFSITLGSMTLQYSDVGFDNELQLAEGNLGLYNTALAVAGALTLNKGRCSINRNSFVTVLGLLYIQDGTSEGVPLTIQENSSVVANGGGNFYSPGAYYGLYVIGNSYFQSTGAVNVNVQAGPYAVYSLFGSCIRFTGASGNLTLYGSSGPLRASTRGYIYVDSGKTLNIQTGTGITAQSGAQIMLSGVSLIGLVATYSPAVNTLGNGNAYIQTTGS